MSRANNAGIQQLLQAEKIANDNVNQAKLRKAKRLKDAKTEAQAEINAERAEKERYYKMCEERIMGKRSEIEAEIERVTAEMISSQNKSVDAHKEEAINMILKLVLEIEHKAELHYKCTKIAKSVSERTGCSVGVDVVCLATELAFRYHQVMATDLECFARHAKRSTVNFDDVLCFVRRNPQLVSELQQQHQSRQKSRQQELTPLQSNNNNNNKRRSATRDQPVTAPVIGKESSPSALRDPATTVATGDSGVVEKGPLENEDQRDDSDGDFLGNNPSTDWFLDASD